MDQAEIAAHWQDWANRFGTDLRATTKTSTIKKLEMAALHRALCLSCTRDNQQNMSILEAGCGNGFNCLALADLLPGSRIWGIDIIEDMILNARQQQGARGVPEERVAFRTGDVLSLDQIHQLPADFDIVFTIRCLINLPTIELQMQGLDQLSGRLRAGGRLIIIENSAQNYARQNHLREQLGLPPRTPAPFNLFLDEEALLAHAARALDLVDTWDFASLHDLLLYVLVPGINGGEIDYQHPIVQAATDLCLAGAEPNQFGSFGQNRLFLFEKRQSP